MFVPSTLELNGQGGINEIQLDNFTVDKVMGDSIEEEEQVLLSIWYVSTWINLRADENVRIQIKIKKPDWLLV